MAVVYVKVYDAKIQSLFAPSGEIGRFARGVGKEAVGIARARGPKRTGRLVAGIRAPGAMAKFAYSITMTTNAPYAKYVIHGTGPRIYPKNGSWLKVPRHRGMALVGRGRKGADREYTFRRSVRGQRANPFLQDAMSSALRSRGIGVSFL